MSNLRPLINGKLEDKTCGDGTSLDSIFEDDVHLIGLGDGVVECINAAFNVASRWASMFEPYQTFFDENDALDLDKLQEEDHGKQLGT